MYLVRLLIAAVIVGVAGLVVATRMGGTGLFNGILSRVAQQGAAAVTSQSSNPTNASLADTRKDFKTAIVLPKSTAGPVPRPPRGLFNVVSYPSPVGPLPAYLTPDPKDGARHPAIVWITGGDTNSIGDVWSPAPRNNDQTASAFRKAGIVMMFPSQRGGNDNPGREEGFYGEVDDVIAAADFLAKQPYVDPARIYLGGHSTGGTLVLLTAETTSRFRAVFAFGPATQGTEHSTFFENFDFSKYDPKEVSLRAPAQWLSSIHGPVFVIEGQDRPSNVGPLEFMRRRSTNPLVSFLAVPGATHFSVLAPSTEVIAQKILKDTGPTTQISLTPAELAQAVSASR